MLTTLILSPNYRWRYGRPIPPHSEQPTPQTAVWKGETGNNTQWPLTVTTRFQSHHLRRWEIEAPSSFTKKTAKKPLFIHHQSAIYPRNQRSTSFAMSGNVTKIDAPQATSIKHQNMFDNILCMNGFLEDSIDQTKHPQSHQRNSPPPNVDWSYLKIPYISKV